MVRLRSSFLASSTALLLVFGATAQAQGATQPDQVLRKNSKGTIVTVSGKVKVATLDEVVITEGNGRDRTVDGDDVVRVTFGTIPPAMVEGRAYWNKGDYENAAAKFKVAAGDASASEAVRARARLKAIEAFMAQGARDQSAFALAKSEAETFASEFATSRDLPNARYLLARAKRLGGDAAGAATDFQALANDAMGEGRLESYPAVLGFRAGIAGAEALVEAGDTLAARELYLKLDGALPRAIADATDPKDARVLTYLQADARLGEGFCMLAGESLAQARTFFQGKLTNAGDNLAQRFGATLGLAEVHLADGKHRDAQLAFAEVCALDHTSRDRVARALVGLAKASLELPDSSGPADAKARIQTVLCEYGDTPAILEGAKMAKTLGVECP